MTTFSTNPSVTISQVIVTQSLGIQSLGGGRPDLKRTATRPLSVRHWTGMLKGKARDRMVATFNIETLPTNNRSHFFTCKSYIYECPSETPSKFNRELVVATAG